MIVKVYPAGSKLYSVHAYSHKEKTCDCGMCVNGLVVGWMDTKSFSFECPNSDTYESRRVASVMEFAVSGWIIQDKHPSNPTVTYLYIDGYGQEMEVDDTRIFDNKEDAFDCAKRILAGENYEYVSRLKPYHNVEIPDIGSTCYGVEATERQAYKSGGIYTPGGTVGFTLPAITMDRKVVQTNVGMVTYYKWSDHERLELRDGSGHECYLTSQEAQEEAGGRLQRDWEFVDAVKEIVKSKTRVGFEV